LETEGGWAMALTAYRPPSFMDFPAFQIDIWVLVAVNIPLRLRINRQFNVVAVYATISECLLVVNLAIRLYSRPASMIPRIFRILLPTRPDSSTH
jgi:hypothetical protein